MVLQWLIKLLGFSCFRGGMDDLWLKSKAASLILSLRGNDSATEEDAERVLAPHVEAMANTCCNWDARYFDIAWVENMRDCTPD
jgi:hypothetical protein